MSNNIIALTNSKRNKILTRLLSEYAGQETTNHTTNTMKLENFQPIIYIQPIVYVFKRSTGDGSYEADESCRPDRDVACCWGDADEAGDCTFAGSYCRELFAVTEVVYQTLWKLRLVSKKDT